MTTLAHSKSSLRRWIGAPFALLVGVSGCGDDSARTRNHASNATLVVTATVAPQPWRDSIEALGTARANEAVTVTAKVSEIVRKVGFESGDLVEAGHVLIDLSDGAQLARLEEARAAYLEAERQLRRQQDLAERRLVAVSQLDAHSATRDAAQARMDIVRAELSDRVITAPFSGILGQRQVSPGSLVTPGTPIATLDDISVIRLDFSVPERYLAVLAPGQEITAHSATYPDRDFGGTVRSVDSRIDPVTRSIAVRAAVPNPDRLLRPGMLMTVLLFLKERQTLTVPEIAIVQIGPDTFLFRATPASTVESIKVKLGARRKGEVEITQGLAAGDRVVIEGIVKLTHGAPIREARAASPGLLLQDRSSATTR